MSFITVHVGGKPMRVSTEGIFTAGIFSRVNGNGTSIFVPKVGFISTDEDENEILGMAMEDMGV